MRNRTSIALSFRLVFHKEAFLRKTAYSLHMDDKHSGGIANFSI